MKNSKGQTVKLRKVTRENLAKLGVGKSSLSRKGVARSSEILISKYEKRFVKTKVDEKTGRKVRMDSRTGEPYNKQASLSYINKIKYGTETPKADDKYLQKKEYLDSKTGGKPIGSRWNLFIDRSKAYGSDKTVAQKKHDQNIQERKDRLERDVKPHTSFKDEKKDDKDEKTETKPKFKHTALTSGKKTPQQIKEELAKKLKINKEKKNGGK